MAFTKDLPNDERFSRVSKDPRFWEMPEKDMKIKIDKRFRAMFDDKKFNLKYTVDKRGRPMNHSTVQDMKRFYDLSESEDSDSAAAPHSEQSHKEKKKKKKKKQMISDSTELNTSSQLNEECKNKDKVEFLEYSDSQERQKSFTVTNSIRNPTLKMDKGEKKDCKVTSTPKSQTKGGNKLPQKREKERMSLTSADWSKERIEMTANTTNNKTRKCTEETKKESENDEAVEQESIDESQSEDESLILGERHEEDDDDDDAEDSGTGLEDEDRVMQTSEDDNSDSEEEEDGESDSGPDLARGKGNMETSSEDELDDDMVDVFTKEPEFDHAWGELDKTAPQTDEITRRLAVCNMDWDRLKAKDLLALFNSFKPKGGVIFSVKIYPSEYGKERMQKETVQGPIELKELPEDATDEQKICREKLREYQFKRLKYFYAVVECDSPETANSIYEECDGLEYESSCSFVDLRFIPDDVTFDDETKDMATDVDFTAYKPKYFTSPAMTTAKVEITWDETDNERLSSLNRTFKKDEILDMDFQAYLASSSEDEVEEYEVEHEDHEPQQGKAGEESAKSKKSYKDDDEQIAKYRELLKSIQDKDKKHEENDMEMEITWVPGFKESAAQMVKNKLEGKDSLTPWEKYLQKKKDKRKLKKNKKDDKKDEPSEDELPPDVDLSDPFFAEEFSEPELKKKSKKKNMDIKREASGEESDVERQKAEIALLMMDDDEDDRKHFNYEKLVEQQNLSKKKKKKLIKKQELLEDDFEINVADTRFQSMFTSHLYNVDPSDPHFKKTKAMEKVLEEKVRRREQQSHHTEALKNPENETVDVGKQQNTVKKSLDPALSMLIKSVKSKTEQFQARKKQKVI